jgi:hypothetical protein
MLLAGGGSPPLLSGSVRGGIVSEPPADPEFSAKLFDVRADYACDDLHST